MLKSEGGSGGSSAEGKRLAEILLNMLDERDHRSVGLVWWLSVKFGIAYENLKTAPFSIGMM